MPFIRYRTGDWGMLKKGKCACGRNYHLLKLIRGRWNQEVIYGTTGNVISLTAINAHSEIYDQVKQYQFFQDTPGVVWLRVVRDTGYTDKDTTAILKELNEKLGGTISLRLQFVEDISRTERGKFQFLDQKIPPGLISPHHSPGSGPAGGSGDRDIANCPENNNHSGKGRKS